MKRAKETLPADHEMQTFGCLNDDILFDVLSPLQTKDLLALKAVSKRWQKLICDRSFIHVQSKKKEPLSGFFFQQRFELCQDDIKIINYVPVETKGSKLRQKVFDFLPEDVVVLSSCNGLVCCRSCFPSHKPSIYVCNPLNKDWTKIHWIEPDKDSSITLAFDPFQDFADECTNFKVVKVMQIEEEEDKLFFSFDIFCSRTVEWKLSKEICWCNYSLHKNKGLLIKGVLHWLTDGDQILTFEVENELAWLISAPVPAQEFNSVPEACIGESDNKLHYIMISEEGLHVWFLEDYFDLNWSLKSSKTLAEMEKEHPKCFFKLHERIAKCKELISSPWVDPLAFKDGFLLMRVSNDIYLYHVESSKMEKVGGISKFGDQSMFCTVLPYSMSLVPLQKA